MKFRIIKNAWWMWWARGMVFWPFVFLKYGKINTNPTTEYQRREVEQVRQNNTRIFRHELQHVYQMAEVGVIKFYLIYLRDRIKHGYRKIPAEVEAYDIDDTPLTPEEQHWRKQGRINVFVSEDVMRKSRLHTILLVTFISAALFVMLWAGKVIVI